MKNSILLLFLAASLLTSCKSNHLGDLGDGLYAAMKTNKGDIVLRLEYDKTPVTVANFVSLAEGTSPFVSESYKGKPYYDGLTFHRVIKDFMIQGGDPTGTGSGSPGYRFADEIRDSLRHDGKGILSMANAGPKTNGSQFFITHAPTPWLDGRHTVFGEVVSGLEVVDSIAGIQVSENGNKPLDPIVMEKVEIIRKGKAAKDFDAVQVMTDYFEKESAIEAAQQEVFRQFVSQITEQKTGAKTLPTGLAYQVVKEGAGAKPGIGDRVWVEYAGWLEDGTLIDTSVESVAEAFGRREELMQMHGGQFGPAAMDYSPDTQLIAGFREALLAMKVGDKWRVFIPAHLGYGEQGRGPIPPNAPLVFDLEITGIQLEAQNN